jgi:hypothetical protein
MRKADHGYDYSLERAVAEVENEWEEHERGDTEYYKNIVTELEEVSRPASGFAVGQLERTLVSVAASIIEELLELLEESHNIYVRGNDGELLTTITRPDSVAITEAAVGEWLQRRMDEALSQHP